MAAMKDTLALIARKESGSDPDRVWSQIAKEHRPFVPKSSAGVVSDLDDLTDKDGNFDESKVVRKNLTEMTVQEVLNWQDCIDKHYLSEAAGKYQILEDTLREIAKGMESYVFTEAFQDRMAIKLMKRRGLARAGKGLSVEQFCINLSKEWASLPVVINCRGSERDVKKGQSYYAGDGLNRAGVDPDEFLACVRSDLGLSSSGPSVKTLWSEDQIKTVQKELRLRGYEVGKIDGIAGAATQRAVAGFEKDNELPSDGQIDEQMLAKLLAAPAKKVCEKRAKATFKDIEGSETVKDGKRQLAAGGLISGTGLLAVAEPYIPRDSYGLSQVAGMIEPVADMVRENIIAIIVVLGFVVAGLAGKQIWKRLLDHRSGKNMTR